MIDRVTSAAGSVPKLMASLYDRSMNRVLARPFEVTSAPQARDLLDRTDDDNDRVSAQLIQKIALIVTPLLRRTAIVQRIPGIKRFPIVFSVVTGANVARSIRTGVHEVQVVGSYLAFRLRYMLGREPDPAVVKSLTIQMYLHPSRTPDPTAAAKPTPLLWRWLVSGLIGRSSKKAGKKAVNAVERLDVRKLASSLDGGTVAERTIAPALKAGG